MNMAAGRWGRWRFLRRAAAALLLAAVLGPAAAAASGAGSLSEPRSRVQVLCGSNWSLVLQGQWMLEL